MDEHNPDGDRRDAANSTGTGLYGKIESVPVTVDAVSLEGTHIETEDRTFERTIICVRGDGSTGFGEDVTRSIEAHKRLRKDGLTLPTGDWTIGTFADALDADSTLSALTRPREMPEYVRWAIESAVHPF